MRIVVVDALPLRPSLPPSRAAAADYVQVMRLHAEAKKLSLSLSASTGNSGGGGGGGWAAVVADSKRPFTEEY